jgi:arsenite methyltransferase
MQEQQQLKEKVKERYGKIALTGNSDCSCSSCCCTPPEEKSAAENDGSSLIQSAIAIGYDSKDIESIPETSILGVGCGVPTKFANIKQGEVVVDLGSGAGIDVFLSANQVGKQGKVIGIDLTDEMLEKARNNAKDSNNYTNVVEFRKGDIERRIPVEDNTADLVISNCVINLTTDKVSTFKEIHRILKNDGGRMVISDLVADREVDKDSINPEKWCSCIDGALTRKNYLHSIRKAGFQNVEILEEKSYTAEGGVDKLDDGRRITSLVIRAVKD